MKENFPIAATLIAGLFLSSCVVDSVHPLCPPAKARADANLVGDWHTHQSSDEVLHISVVDAHQMHLECTGKNEPTESYDLFPTVINHSSFLSVRSSIKGHQNHPPEAYLFIRYRISADHVLSTWWIDQDKVAAAVRSGKLKGIVRQDKNGTQIGSPPHPDVDVEIQDNSSRIVEFIRAFGEEALFDDKGNDLYPVVPAAR